MSGDLEEAGAEVGGEGGDLLVGVAELVHQQKQQPRLLPPPVTPPSHPVTPRHAPSHPARDAPQTLHAPPHAHAPRHARLPAARWRVRARATTGARAETRARGGAARG